MLKTQEIVNIVFAVVILTFVVNFLSITNNTVNANSIGISIIFLLLIILVNIVAKKITANYYESTLEIKIWGWQRYGLKRNRKLKKPLPMGIILPFLISILTFGNFLVFSVLESNIEGTSARASKRHGRYRFTEMTDSNIGMIISMGVVANLVLAIIAYLVNLGELARWNIYYAAYSLIPFGNLDGTKIFFGKKVWWFALTIITLIALSYALLLP